MTCRSSEDSDLVLGPTPKHRWAYACSKAIDEFLALAYWKERKLPVIIVRFFNTVGPRQTGRYGMVIPNFVRQALAGEPITVFGDGTQSRSFTHVADVVGALLKLVAEPTAIGQVINLGNTEEVTIGALAERVRTLAGSSSPIKNVPYDEAYESGFEDMPRRVPDLTKARNMIGYEPKLGLDDILVADHRILPEEVRPRLDPPGAARILGECEFQVHFSSLPPFCRGLRRPAQMCSCVSRTARSRSRRPTPRTRHPRGVGARRADANHQRRAHARRTDHDRAERHQRGTSARNHPALRRRVRDRAARIHSRQRVAVRSNPRHADELTDASGDAVTAAGAISAGATAVSGPGSRAVPAAVPAPGSAAVSGSGRAVSAAVSAAIPGTASGERRRRRAGRSGTKRRHAEHGPAGVQRQSLGAATCRPVRHASRGGPAAGRPAAGGRLDARHGRSGAAATAGPARNVPPGAPPQQP